jgi:hypothetical protein
MRARELQEQAAALFGLAEDAFDRANPQLAEELTALALRYLDEADALEQARSAPSEPQRGSGNAIQEAAAPHNGQSGPSAPVVNRNEPEKQKRTVEVRIGRDEDDYWWVVVIVDANDNEATWRGPYEDHEAAEKEGLALAAEIDNLDDEGFSRFIVERPPTRH